MGAFPLSFSPPFNLLQANFDACFGGGKFGGTLTNTSHIISQVF